LKVKPHQVTLVPDPPGALTSNAGWDTVKNQKFLQDIVKVYQREGIRVSIFVDTNPENIRAAASTGTDRIELYTEPYASLYPENRERAILPFYEAAVLARDLSLEINAGHDLSLENLTYFAEKIPWIKEVSIGHALISDALYLGLQQTIDQYKKCLIY